ncbi:MAG: hypothetical protein GY750_00245 [Lentisphaerae bacterium]|nr:hypothetical protein [Lentisphaerota bacterium]MCP4099850.1 hypothetical protein [Lentisphaerota bacterium]
MMLILVLAAVFMFDLHNIIRAKIKLETAEQAAALSAANWQKESLNLIGEINLIKACDVLISDIPPTSDSPEDIEASSKALTEMQSRVSFAGPLIGFGAAQQAAKNNGVNIFDSDSEAGTQSWKTVHTDMDDYLSKLQEDPRYQPPAAPQFVNHYNWHEPYVQMLQLIRNQGLAVRPNGRFPGLESVEPGFLTDRYLYDAIIGQLWCQPTLNVIIKYPDSYWEGKWWSITYQNTNFPEESEIYTLGLEYRGGESARETVFEPAEASIRSLAAARGLNVSEWKVLRYVTWCIYDSTWFAESSNYSGPDLTWWRGGRFLRQDIRQSALYGGAVAYAECYQHIKLASQYKSRMLRPISPDNPSYEKDLVAKAKSAFENDVVTKMNEQYVKVGNDMGRDNEPGGVVAKPLGQLPNGQAPTAAVMVLPVFDRAVMIPSTMQGYRAMRVDFTDLERFLIWLADVDDLNSPGSAPPSGTEKYLLALQRLNNPEYRKQGWNNDFSSSSVSDEHSYFNDDYRYDSILNQAGAGWLQQIWLGSDGSVAGDLSAGGEIRVVERGYNTAYYLGNRYFLRSGGNNTLITNEQMICRWPPGGGSNPGTRIGPPRL